MDRLTFLLKLCLFLLFPATFSQAAGESVDNILQLNEKLKKAVCDENFVSKAPSLESLSVFEKNQNFILRISENFAEQDLVAFLMGDNASVVASGALKAQLQQAFKTRGLDIVLGQLQQMPSDDLLSEVQSTVGAIKRHVSLEVCEALVHQEKLKKMFEEQPSHFFYLSQLDSKTSSDLNSVLLKTEKGQIQFILRDTQNRFGHGLSGAPSRHLIAGWIDSFEVEFAAFGGGAEGVRIYQRVFNPLTNNLQAVEVLQAHANGQLVPLATLFLAKDQVQQNWAGIRGWADLPEAKARQNDMYRQRVEFDAIRTIEQGGADRLQVKNLQDFYKNLINAYRLMPDEQQFQSYAKIGTDFRISFDDIAKKLGPNYLSMLGKARVNGSFVRLGVFKPDPKLTAIYSEYRSRLDALVNSKKK